MRELTATLLAAQQSSSRVPYVQILAQSQFTGAKRLRWQRLYSGSETGNFHAAAMAGDGSLLRVRVCGEENFRLYRQRVTNPGAQANFAAWTATGIYACQAVALAVNGTGVYLFFMTLNGELKLMQSSDHGASWSSPVILDYAAALPVFGLAATVKTNGDVAVFFTGNDTLYVKKRVNGTWQAKTTWDKTSGELSAVAVVYDGDWLLMLTGKDEAGNAKMWTAIYGDGHEIPAGEWSDLTELAAAPAGSDYVYGGVSLARPDVYRLFFVEKVTGVNPMSRVYESHTIIDSLFSANLWQEPLPFEYGGEGGLAFAGDAVNSWLSAPDGVWHAQHSEATRDLTPDIVGAQWENGTASGRLTVELNNTGGKYAFPGSGTLEMLDIGGALACNPGYRTAAGNETSEGLVFRIAAYEHINLNGENSLVVTAVDGWQDLADWRARHQFRWNASAPVNNVKYLLCFVLARAGLRLEVISESLTVNDYCPDFTIHRGDSGLAIINRLLSFVPDVILIEGGTAYLKNPQESDTADYVYGMPHAILQAKYQTLGWETNRAQVTGYTPETGEEIRIDTVNWLQLAKYPERLQQLNDRNLKTTAETTNRSEIMLRKAQAAAVKGEMIVPVNCGQRLYDVIEVSDASAGLAGVKKRVKGIALSYRPERGEYTHKLILGGV
ncbi:MAG: hypothetical protein PHE50_05515 [Dehalococcoidales bacterium]|nr:hypothetical protein [Dehalococcoidales bacterium]